MQHLLLRQCRDVLLNGSKVLSAPTITQFNPFPFCANYYSTSNSLEQDSRTVGCSFVERSFSLSTNPSLRLRFASAVGSIRLGCVLEEMDVVAGIVGYKHVTAVEKHDQLLRLLSTTTEPNTAESDLMTSEQTLQSICSSVIVTAACDRITLLPTKQPPSINRDLLITGKVTYVGRSSMEILVELKQRNSENKLKAVMQGYFTMVNLNSQTGKSEPVPRLVVESEEEKFLWQKGEVNSENRKANSFKNRYKEPPVGEDSKVIHELCLSRPSNADNFRTPASTRQEATRFMHPQNRNIHKKVFGGYIMRSAFELAYITACLYCKVPKMRFLSMDDITFHHPVDIGSILSISSKVIFANDKTNNIQLSVVADVVNPVTGDKKTTNTFHYTFNSTSENTVTKVLPQTYREALYYCFGKKMESEVAAACNLTKALSDHLNTNDVEL